MDSQPFLIITYLIIPYNLVFARHVSAKTYLLESLSRKNPQEYIWVSSPRPWLYYTLNTWAKLSQACIVI